MPFAFCYIIINYFMFFNLFVYVCFLVLYVLLSILCVLCFCIVLCIVSPHVYSCSFYICVQFYRPLSPGGNPIVVNKYVYYYHTSFHISFLVTYRIIPYHIPEILRSACLVYSHVLYAFKEKL